ncbi:hypothetical protein [Duganella sp. Leaf61]|uniref:hypothetical protein n=1 Tax=Duganella sp. Leaf61 TaxID=1736227 RepID=UPI001910463A|nr:hypothetical protein [Duganella sp. Leaf61]
MTSLKKGSNGKVQPDHYTPVVYAWQNIMRVQTTLSGMSISGAVRVVTCGCADIHRGKIMDKNLKTGTVHHTFVEFNGNSVHSANHRRPRRQSDSGVQAGQARLIRPAA